MLARIARKAKVGPGDAVFFAADQKPKAARIAGLARTRIGRDLGLVREDVFELCWVVDFPMYEWNEDEKKIDFSHNPFSMPQGGLAALEVEGPARPPRLPVRRRLQRHRAVVGRDPGTIVPT